MGGERHTRTSENRAEPAANGQQRSRQREGIKCKRETIIGGVLLTALGLWAGLHSIANFEIGSMGRMGPGMFPTALGFLLAGIGVVIAIPAFFRAGTGAITIEWRAMFFVFAGILIFAFTLLTFGMIPATILLALCGAAADTKLSWKSAIIVAVGIAALAYLIFIIGLGIVLEPFRWPF
jgi:hypothetical protein